MQPKNFLQFPFPIPDCFLPKSQILYRPNPGVPLLLETFFRQHPILQKRTMEQILADAHLGSTSARFETTLLGREVEKHRHDYELAMNIILAARNPHYFHCPSPIGFYPPCLSWWNETNCRDWIGQWQKTKQRVNEWSHLDPSLITQGGVYPAKLMLRTAHAAYKRNIGPTSLLRLHRMISAFRPFISFTCLDGLPW